MKSGGHDETRTEMPTTRGANTTAEEKILNRRRAKDTWIKKIDINHTWSLSVKPKASHVISMQIRQLVLGGLFLVPVATGCSMQDDSAAPPEDLSSTAQEIIAVSAPSLSIPDTALYCSVVWPTAGGSYWVGDFGDLNANPCSTAAGSRVRRTGMFTNNRWNIAETRCDPSYYWVYQTWGGSDAIRLATNDAANTQTNGNCFLKVTIADALRTAEDTVGPIDYFSDIANSSPLPTPAAYPHTGKTFNAVYFQNQIAALLSASPPTGYSGPVGYQLSVRAPLTVASPAPLNTGVLVDVAAGNVVGYQPLPSGGSNGVSTSGMGNPAMDVNRRFDLASVSKTITAVAALAAFDDLAEYGNPQHVTLESSINPYLQMIWPGGVDASVQSITFRDLLRHTTPLCRNGRSGGDSYAQLKALMAQSPTSWDGVWQPGPTQSQVGIYQYCNHNYALLRILLPLLVEGGAAFHNPDGTLKTDAQIDNLTAISYRNYVRNRVFDPIGLSGVDDYYTGTLPETIYFGANGLAIPDQVNVGAGANWGYDQRANTTVRSAGSGFWFLSAKEYSLFIANLWAGNIIPQSSVLKMLTPYSLGMSIGSLPSGKTTWGKEGGGGWGGPWTQWVTFSDGYSAVLFSNSPAGTVSFRQMLEQTYDAAWQ
jgi:CubicO group peptidase (beta-lactamase class C family)